MVCNENKILHNEVANRGWDPRKRQWRVLLYSITDCGCTFSKLRLAVNLSMFWLKSGKLAIVSCLIESKYSEEETDKTSASADTNTLLCVIILCDWISNLLCINTNLTSTLVTAFMNWHCEPLAVCMMKDRTVCSMEVLGFNVSFAIKFRKNISAYHSYQTIN